MKINANSLSHCRITFWPNLYNHTCNYTAACTDICRIIAIEKYELFLLFIYKHYCCANWGQQQYFNKHIYIRYKCLFLKNKSSKGMLFSINDTVQLIVFIIWSSSLCLLFILFFIWLTDVRNLLQISTRNWITQQDLLWLKNGSQNLAANAIIHIYIVTRSKPVQIIITFSSPVNYCYQISPKHKSKRKWKQYY